MNRFNSRTALGAVVVAGVVAGCHLIDDAPADKQGAGFVSGTGDQALGTFQDSLAAAYNADFVRMHEPLLHGARIPGGMTVTRLLWMRSFDPSVVVRITETAGLCVITTTIEGIREPVYGPPDSEGRMRWIATQYGPLLRRDSSELAVQICAGLRTHAVAARLWAGSVTDTIAGNDGDDVIFELADSDGYHFAKRWSPYVDRSPAFWDISIRFINLARVNPEMRKHGLY